MTTEQGFPVAPVQESEMEQAKGIFERMAQAIVAASQVGPEIEALRQSVEGLKRDLDYLRSRNSELDAQVGEVRRQRDEALTELNDLKARTGDSTRMIENYQRDQSSLNDVIERQRQEIVNLKIQRDDSDLRSMEAEDKWAKARASIESLCTLLPKPKDEVTYDPTTGKWSDDR